jgi:hypothetical protein
MGKRKQAEKTDPKVIPFPAPKPVDAEFVRKVALAFFNDIFSENAGRSGGGKQ